MAQPSEIPRFARDDSLLGMTAFGMTLLVGCKDQVINNPHSLQDYAENIRYGSFASSPKSLDPAQSMSEDELVFIAQIYEAPLQYHYLKRPFTLIPQTAKTMPMVRYWDAKRRKLPDDAPQKQIAYTTYDIQIQPGIYYQPHPAFAQDSSGNYLYLNLSPAPMAEITTLSDFKQTGTRELTAEDYVYGIKRLAHPGLNSPVLGLLQKYVLGLTAYSQQLQGLYNSRKSDAFLDLRNYPLEGAIVLDRYTYRIILQGQYRQFIYWLAMPYFVPIPWEADLFYSQPGMRKKNLSFSWYPVGTGPYLLAENNPNRQMVLVKNPNFHPAYYPSEGEPGDQQAGYLANAGKRLPLIDKYVFSLEKESIPRWNKFLQGYYDQSQISSDTFGEAIQLDATGNPQLTPRLKDRNIRLQTSIQTASFSFGFNMLDPVVGGYSESARKLRQAISIALNEEQFITIFLNGRGIPAQGPIPPGIFGFLAGKEGVNPYVYDVINGEPKRKSIAMARQLLAQAGYPNGRSAQTGKPLVLHYDTSSLTPADKDEFGWMRKQFAQLGIELLIQSTDYNRFLDKLRTGNVQIFPFGWVADYPDPENFLNLLYGPNGQVRFGGNNAANYQNDRFDTLFLQMKALPNGPERLRLLQKMLAIARQDSPWIWGVFPKDFLLAQAWLQPLKPNSIIVNALKYQSLDPALRVQSIVAWNQPIIWPLLIFLLVLLGLLLPAYGQYRRAIRRPIKRYSVG